MALPRLFSPLTSVASSIYAPFRLIFKDSRNLLQDVPALIKQTRINLKDLHGTNLRLAKGHYYRGEYEDAWLRARLAMLFKKDSFASWYWLGCCYRAIGVPKKALKHWQRLLEKQPDNLSAQYEVAKLVAPEQLHEIPTNWLVEKAELQAEEKFEDSWLVIQKTWAQAVDTIARTIPPQNIINTVCEIDAGCARLAPKLRLKSIGRLYYAYCWHALEREAARESSYHELAVYDQVMAMDDLSATPAFDLLVSAKHFLHSADPALILKNFSARIADKAFVAAITCLPRLDDNSKKTTDFPKAQWFESSACKGAHINTSWDIFGHDRELLEQKSAEAGLSIIAQIPLAEPPGAAYFITIWQKT